MKNLINLQVMIWDKPEIQQASMGGEMFNKIMIAIVAIIVLFSILMAIRELMCWYNKTNEKLENQKETNKLLVKILNELQNENKK